MTDHRPTSSSTDRRPIRLDQGDPGLLLKVLLDNMPSAVFWKDTNHVYQGCNAKFAQVAGFETPEDVIGRSDHDMPWNEAGINECIVSDRQVLETGEEMRLIEKLRSPDGADFWVESGKSPIFNAAGEIIGVLGTLIDVTERYKAEQALAEANAKLEQIAKLDGLTAIPNRRHFDETLEREWRRAKRENAPLAVIFFDIDYFKEFNDTYGHLAGDETLASVARTIAAAVRRPADLAARYGGEEFAVILQDTDAAGGLHVAEAILAAVKALKIPHSTGVPGHGVVTLSAGVASLTPNAPRRDCSLEDLAEAPLVTSKDLVDLADKALYSAKHEGRARSVVAPCMD